MGVPISFVTIVLKVLIIVLKLVGDGALTVPTSFAVLLP